MYAGYEVGSCKAGSAKADGIATLVDAFMKVQK
jgi:hypothetical protein